MDRKSLNDWNPDLYDNKTGFVSRFGQAVVELLDPKPNEQILDMGSGTGDLAFAISLSKAMVTGIDNSPAMIEKARQKYPGIVFLLQDAKTFRSHKEFDAVFSNAVLHWIKPPSRVITSVRLALREGGRFVAEFAGKRNVETIMEAIGEVLAGYGTDVSDVNPWFCPSIGEYASLLEEQGFRVKHAIHFDRPTPLEDGQNGLNHWLDMFAGVFFEKLSPAEKSHAYEEIEEKLRPRLFGNGIWTADYKRLRFMAVKE